MNANSFSIAGWLTSEQWTAQSRHHASLRADRADSACEFVLQTDEFREWHEWDHARGPQQLAVVGPMGSGKSSTMAFLVDQLRERQPESRVCYYYCQPGQEGGYVCILSTLVVQLLKGFPEKMRSFVEWYKRAQAAEVGDPAASALNLERILHEIVGDAQSVILAIDGLDECDDASCSRLLSLLGVLQEGSSLKVVLSSRPQEHILTLLAGTPRVQMTADAGRDRIIAQKLVGNKLGYLTQEVKSLVVDALSRTAAGSALWTDMVVKLLARLQIRARDAMERFLNNVPLPEQLSSLYTTLLQRYSSGEPENQALALTALQLLAVARRPLSIVELGWAVALSHTKDVTSVGSLSKLVDPYRITSLIQPFIDTIDHASPKKRQVKLVHQSVNSYMASKSSGTERLQAQMLDVCMRSLLLEEVDGTPLFTEEQAAIAELPQGNDLFCDFKGPNTFTTHCTWEEWERDMIRHDPAERGLGEFFVYASSHWADHYGAVTTQKLVDFAKIRELCRPGSRRLQNWIEQNRRPDCAMLPRFEFDADLYDPLSITALYGAPETLRNMVRTANLSEAGFLPRSVARAAEQVVRWGDLARLALLPLAREEKTQLLDLQFFKFAMKQWSGLNAHRCSDWNTAFDLVNEVTGVMVEKHWADELLHAAEQGACLPVMQRLMDKARNNAALGAEFTGTFAHAVRV